jgi:hypothetical protein
LGLRLFWFAKGGGYPRLQRVVVVLVCKRSSSDLVRHEPNSIEMRCDIAWIWFPSRYIPPAAEHSMSLQPEMRYDKTQNALRKAYKCIMFIEFHVKLCQFLICQIVFLIIQLTYYLMIQLKPVSCCGTTFEFVSHDQKQNQYAYAIPNKQDSQVAFS